jgi:hypothetical protein
MKYRFIETGGRALANQTDHNLSEDLVIKFTKLNEKKKKIEKELDELKKIFHNYFDTKVGQNMKGELVINHYKVQRQVRKTEKFNDELTVNRLEELNMSDLIKLVKKPDEDKVKSALTLGFLKEGDLDGCLVRSATQAIIVKEVKNGSSK